MSFEYEWTVRFGDTDMFGIAFYPRIVEMLHETSDRYVESVGWPYWELQEKHGLGLPVVEVDVEIERPVRAGDDVRIELRPDLGESSVRFDYEAVCDGELVFSGFEQRVCTSHATIDAVPFPTEFRAALESAC